MSGTRWGQAKREVLALQPLIKQRLNEGLTLHRIWQELRDDGRVSVTAKNFYDGVKKVFSPKTEQRTGRDHVPNRSSSSPVIVTVRREDAAPLPDSVQVGPTATFGHNNQPKMDW